MRRSFTSPLVALGVIAMTAGPALAHHPAYHTFDSYKETYTVVRNEADLPVDIDRQTDNVEFISYLDTDRGSDLYFQRREGRQLFRGEVIDSVRDIVALGGTTQKGATLVDVTVPADPQVLSVIPCSGFHSEVLIWENLLLQTFDSSPLPCEEGSGIDPDGHDRPDDRGVRIFDITDPAAPKLVAFRGEAEMIHSSGVHNATLNVEEGLLYLNMAELDPIGPLWGYIDLNDPTYPVHTRSMRDISPVSGDGCHDASVAPTRQLLACAGIEASYIWDISDPRNPVEVSMIVNPGISIHHGARWTEDEQTLVLNDELAGAALAPGCQGIEQGIAGALWFYDASTAALPVLNQTFSVSEASADLTCTSHFYNFSPNEILTVGWYQSGMVAVDFSGAFATELAHFEPEGAEFWSAYSWNGHVFGNSYANNESRGLWTIKVDGIGVFDPLAVDEGNSWSRFTQSYEGGAIDNQTTTVAPEQTVDPVPAATEDVSQLPATGGGLAAGGALITLAAVLRRRR